MPRRICERSDASGRDAPPFLTDGDAFLTLAFKIGLEGIIAKRRDAPYRSVRGGEWLKNKCVQSEGCAIIRYEPSSSALVRAIRPASKRDVNRVRNHG
ncbi:hypothetical protein AB4099_09175 [Bosea sp. 2KB_26]|uniref:hypothetical protein n=1 Tax=Bosea sp. 2KB_26 TaxID=3237475 RepID=UPI003F923F48